MAIGSQKGGCAMKTLIVYMLSIGVILSPLGTVYASDWDTVGKVLTGITGLRILTGGRVDIIGTMTGTNRYNRPSGYYYQTPTRYYISYYDGPRRNVRYYKPQRYRRCERVWVPRRAYWKRVYRHGRYVKQRVVEGGYWVEDCQVSRRRR